MSVVAGRARIRTRAAAFACTPFATLLLAVACPDIAIAVLCLLAIPCALALCGDKRNPRNRP